MRISRGVSPQDAILQGAKNLQDRYSYSVDGVHYDLLKDVIRVKYSSNICYEDLNSDNFPTWIKTML